MNSLIPVSLQSFVYPSQSSQFIEKYVKSPEGELRAEFWRRLPESHLPKVICEGPFIPYRGSMQDFMNNVASSRFWDNRVKYLSITKLDETTDAGIIAVLEKHPSFESLIKRSQEMTMLPRLREFEIHGKHLKADSKKSKKNSALEKLLGVTIIDQGKGLSDVSRLKSIYVENCKEFSQIWEWTRLTHLSIPRSNINAQEMALLVENSNRLTELDIRYCYQMEKTGLIEIAKLVHLRSLRMREFHECRKVDFSSLATLTNLEHLCIQRSSVDSKAILAFVESLRQLKHFHVNSCRVTSLKGQDIKVSSKEVMSKIGSLKNLESLSIDAREKDVVPFAELTRLKKLRIRSSAVNPEMLETYSRHLTQLQEFTLLVSRHAFSKEETFAFSLFQRLTILRLEHVVIRNHALQLPPKLQGLSLSGTSITDEDIGSIVFYCSGLSSLHLNGCNKIGDQAMVSIANELKSLTYLDIGYTQVGDTGMDTLLVGLPFLKNLRFSFTSVTDASIPSLTAKAEKGLEFVYTYGSAMSYSGEKSLPQRLSNTFFGKEKMRLPRI